MNTKITLAHLAAATALTLASVAVHAGSINEDALEKIQPGMSQSDVESTLGKGRVVSFASETGPVWRYTLAQDLDGARGATVYVTFGADGTVSQIQAIELPQSGS